MPYVITYRMLVGTGTRFARTAADAMADCRDLQIAGAALITIRDAAGVALTLDDLLSVGEPRRFPKGRPEPGV